MAMEIAVREKFRGWLIPWNGDEGDLNSRPSCVLHRRDTVRIVGGQCD